MDERLGRHQTLPGLYGGENNLTLTVIEPQFFGRFSKYQLSYLCSVLGIISVKYIFKAFQLILTHIKFSEERMIEVVVDNVL